MTSEPSVNEQAMRAEKADLEKRVRKRESPVLFVHIHKAGGTTLCNMAKSNNLTVPIEYSPSSYSGIAGKNCNPAPNHIRAAWTGSPEEQYEYVSNSHSHSHSHSSSSPCLAADSDPSLLDS